MIDIEILNAPEEVGAGQPYSFDVSLRTWLVPRMIYTSMCITHSDKTSENIPIRTEITASTPRVISIDTVAGDTPGLEKITLLSVHPIDPILPLVGGIPISMALGKKTLQTWAISSTFAVLLAIPCFFRVITGLIPRKTIKVV